MHIGLKYAAAAAGGSRGWVGDAAGGCHRNVARNVYAGDVLDVAILIYMVALFTDTHTRGRYMRKQIRALYINGCVFMNT